MPRTLLSACSGTLGLSMQYILKAPVETGEQTKAPSSFFRTAFGIFSKIYLTKPTVLISDVHMIKETCNKEELTKPDQSRITEFVHDRVQRQAVAPNQIIRGAKGDRGLPGLKGNKGDPGIPGRIGVWKR